MCGIIESFETTQIIKKFCLKVVPKVAKNKNLNEAMKKMKRKQVKKQITALSFENIYQIMDLDFILKSQIPSMLSLVENFYLKTMCLEELEIILELFFSFYNLILIALEGILSV